MRTVRSWTKSSFLRQKKYNIRHFTVQNDANHAKCLKWNSIRATFECVHFVRSHVYPRYWLQRDCLCVDKVQRKQRKMAAMALLPNTSSACVFFRNSFDIVHNKWCFFSRASYSAKLKIVFTVSNVVAWWDDFFYVAFSIFSFFFSFIQMSANTLPHVGFTIKL